MPGVRILQLTDLHVFREPGLRLKGIPTRELFEDVVRHILDSGEAFDYVVITGDHTHDELPESYAAVRQILHPWIDRLWQVPGNHDDRRVLRSVFSDRVSGTGDERIQFAFSAGEWMCAGLDTHLPGSVSGRLLPDQIEWLRLQIQRHDPARIAVFLHHPPVSIGSVWMDAIGLEGREHLQELLSADSRIRLVCCGHVHHEFHTRFGSAEIVSTPSTGIQFNPEGNAANFVAAPPGYRIIELTDAGYTTRVVRLPEIRFSPVASL